MLKLCGETEERLAQELIQFEFQIERDVVEPLCLIAEVRLSGTSCTFTLHFYPPLFSQCSRQVDIPNIQKQRKHLAKLVLDMDSARTRFEARLEMSTDFMELKLPLPFASSTDISSHQNRPATRARCSLAQSPSLSERRWRRQPIGWRYAG